LVHSPFLPVLVYVFKGRISKLFLLLSFIFVPLYESCSYTTTLSFVLIFVGWFEIGAVREEGIEEGFEKMGVMLE